MNPEHAATNAAIARLKHEGLKWEKIGRLLGLTGEVCRDRYRRMKQRALTAAPATGNDASPVEHVGESRVEPIPAAVPRVASVLELPPRPFAVPLGPGVHVAPTPTGHNFTALLHGDRHAPYHDLRACALVEALAAELQPNVLVDMGDGVDCYEISRFGKDPHLRSTLQDAINIDRRATYRIRNRAPNARSVRLEGNHEDRLRRAIEDMPEVAKQVLMLSNVDREVNWPRLLDLDGMGTEWVPILAQPITDVVPKIVLTHGSRVHVAAGYSARAELMHYGKSGASGHTHRLAVFHKRDLTGVATWIETGCTCQIVGQTYIKNPDWQQGCVFIEWSADRRLMDVHMISFRDGRALWHGKEFSADVDA